MNEHMEKKLELLKELTEYLEKNKIKYYLGGDILINIYNNIEISNNVKFKVCVCEKTVNNINTLISENRAIEEVYDKNKKLIYRYINKNTLYYDLYDKNNSNGIYIEIYTNEKDYNNYTNTKITNFLVKIPKNLDLYLKNNYGLGYKYLNEKKTSIPGYVVYNANISFEIYLNEIKKNKLKHKKHFFYKYDKKLAKQKKYNTIINNYKNLVKRTDARYKLLKKYENIKEEIIKSYKSKDYSKLKNYLNDYLYEIKKFYDLNLGLCFDKDIFDITIDYLRYDKQDELANWLLANTPTEHLCNMDFTYNDKNVTNKDQYIDLDNKHLELMKMFDKYCKDNDIQYFYDGGSVLGAIRHNDFIPWDSDVDVLMTYDNYEKFRKTIENKPIKDMKFVDVENTPTYPINFGRLYDLNSFRLYWTDSLLSSSYGYHIDIFALDKKIENKVLNKLHLYLFIIYGQLLNEDAPMYNINLSFICHFCEFFMKIFGRERILKLFQKILFSVNNKKEFKNYKYRWRKVIYYDKKVFEKQLYVPFRDMSIPIPCLYEDYLEKQYGESWFIYPPKSECRKSTKIFNLYVPYNLYQDDFLYFTDKKATNKAFKKVKYLKMRRANLGKKIDKLKLLYKYYASAIQINKTIDINKVKEYYNNNEYGKIKEYLSAYYSLQSKKMYLNNGMLFFEDKEFLYEVVYTLIMCGEFYNARKLIKSPKIKEILEDSYDKLNKLMDDAKNISKKSDKDKKNLFKEHPYCINFYLEYYSLIKTNDEKKNEIDKFNKVYPNYGEVMYIEALYNLEMNNVKTAIELFNTAKENTRNGLIIKRINEILNDLNK